MRLGLNFDDLIRVGHLAHEGGPCGFPLEDIYRKLRSLFPNVESPIRGGT